MPEIRKGDTVVVLAGKDAGKRGTVERVIRRDGRRRARRAASSGAAPRAGGVSVVVEGLNIAKRHTKPRQTRGHQRPRPARSSRAASSTSPQPLPVSRVMLVCPNCGKPTRIAHATLDTGRRVRVCRHCGEQLEVKA